MNYVEVHEAKNALILVFTINIAYVFFVNTFDLFKTNWLFVIFCKIIICDVISQNILKISSRFINMRGKNISIKRCRLIKQLPIANLYTQRINQTFVIVDGN